MILQQTVLALIITAFFASSSTKAYNSSTCEQSCSAGKSAKSVPYPFGFTDGCNIQLNCSGDGHIKIGEFEVQNITTTSIFINIPAKCNRPIDSIKHLFGQNYGITFQNSLLLRNCSSHSSLNGCLIPTSFVETRFNLEGCANTNENDTISCFTSKESEKVAVFDYTVINKTSCRSLYSSFAVDSTTNNSSFSLEFQNLELAWWLEKHYKCHPKATLKTVLLPGGHSGIRCNCKDGFQGDGFKDGLGCDRVFSQLRNHHRSLEVVSKVARFTVSEHKKKH